MAGLDAMTRAEEGEVGSRHVGYDQVDERRVPIREVETRVDRGESGQERRRGCLCQARQAACAEAGVDPLLAQGRTMDARDPGDGIREVDRELGEHRRDLIAGGSPLRLRDRDRERRHERLLRRCAGLTEHAAQRPGADGQHHVVDLDPEGRAQRAELVERGARERHLAPRGDRAVQGCVRSREACGGRRPGRLRPDRAQPRERAADHLACHAVGRRRRRTGGAEQGAQHRRGAFPRRSGLGVRRCFARCIRVRVEQAGEDLRAGNPVHQRVVELGQHGRPSVCEPLDHPEFPEWARPVERKRRQVADHLSQLVGTTGGGERDAMHVRVELERTLHPDGAVESERRPGEVPTEDRQRLEARGQVCADRRKARGEPIRAGCERDEPGHVHRCGVGLDGQKDGVEAGQRAIQGVLLV
jgi:hypothetical protein